MSADEYLPEKLTLPAMSDAVERCRGCELYRKATQAVFGEGAADAGVVLVGEQPGDQEDLQGRPFVGPAGRLLDETLQEAGISRESVYVTNAVKHFKWEPRGKRRLHKKPSAREVAACSPWLEAELAAIDPRVVVCLGATAAQSLLGRDFRITKQRGQWIEGEEGHAFLATWHPSAVLRVPGSDMRKQRRKELVSDLASVAARLQNGR